MRLAVILLVGAGYSSGLGLAVLYYTGGKMNLLMTMLPPLIYVLTISAGVHLINYYRDAIREGGLAGAPDRAIAQGWLPCLLAAGTPAACNWRIASPASRGRAHASIIASISARRPRRAASSSVRSPASGGIASQSAAHSPAVVTARASPRSSPSHR